MSCPSLLSAKIYIDYSWKRLSSFNKEQALLQICDISMYIDVNIGGLVRDGGWDGEITTLAPSPLAAGPG